MEHDPTGRDTHSAGRQTGRRQGARRPCTRRIQPGANGGCQGRNLRRKEVQRRWVEEVPDGEKRHRAAGDRHRLRRKQERMDSDTGLDHLAHEAWNRLAELELKLRDEVLP